MAATLTKRNNTLLYRLKALANLQSQFQVQRLKQTLSGLESMQPEVDPQGQADMSKWKSLNARKLGVHRMMIPQQPWVVLNRLHKEGFQVYLVGGCVRDLILKRVPKDFDVITTASLRQVKKKFYPCMIVGQRFPVCRVHVKETVIEVTSFETISEHEKGREKVLISQMPSGCGESDFIRWKNSMHRDFTINSLFYDPFVNKIYDYADGMADLKDLKLRTLIPAQMSFKEDCARILRAIRIAARLGLSFSEDIETAIQHLSWSIKTLAKSRLTMELNTMLSYGAAERSLSLLQQSGILEILFPFHAKYLDQQGPTDFLKRSSMLMQLFSNLDRLVACDRPSNSCVWVGLLAFHLALVNNPQDAFVVKAFASVLYHGNWKEGAEFARKHYARGQVNFVPEISDSSNFESDEKLAEGVTKFASLVQLSIADLTRAYNFVEVMLESPDSPRYELGGHISEKMQRSVAEIFNVLVHDIKSYDEGRTSFDIDYHSLGEGSLSETRLVLGKVILGTMKVVVQSKSKIVKEEKDHPQRLEIENEQKSNSDLIENLDTTMFDSTYQEAVTTKSIKRKRPQSRPALETKGSENFGEKVNSSNQFLKKGDHPQRREIENELKLNSDLIENLDMIMFDSINQEAVTGKSIKRKRSHSRPALETKDAENFREKQEMFETKECLEKVKSEEKMAVEQKLAGKNTRKESKEKQVTKTCHWKDAFEDLKEQKLNSDQAKEKMFKKHLQFTHGRPPKPLGKIMFVKEEKEVKRNTTNNDLRKKEKPSEKKDSGEKIKKQNLSVAESEKKDSGEKIKKQNQSVTEKKTSLPPLSSLFK